MTGSAKRTRGYRTKITKFSAMLFALCCLRMAARASEFVVSFLASTQVHFSTPQTYGASRGFFPDENCCHGGKESRADHTLPHLLGAVVGPWWLSAFTGESYAGLILGAINFDRSDYQLHNTRSP